MNRRIFNVLALASLTLLLATVMLWILSERGYDQLICPLPFGFYCGIYPAPGELWVQGWSSEAAYRRDMLFNYRDMSAISGGRCFIGSWSIVRAPSRGGRTGEIAVWTVVLADWPICLVFVILPAWKMNSLIRKQKLAAQGFCKACGYDLRATPDRCPECGATAGGISCAAGKR